MIYLSFYVINYLATLKVPTSVIWWQEPVSVLIRLFDNGYGWHGVMSFSTEIDDISSTSLSVELRCLRDHRFAEVRTLSTSVSMGGGEGNIVSSNVGGFWYSSVLNCSICLHLCYRTGIMVMWGRCCQLGINR